MVGRTIVKQIVARIGIAANENDESLLVHTGADEMDERHVGQCLGKTEADPLIVRIEIVRLAPVRCIGRTDHAPPPPDRDYVVDIHVRMAGDQLGLETAVQRDAVNGVAAVQRLNRVSQIAGSIDGNRLEFVGIRLGPGECPPLPIAGLPVQICRRAGEQARIVALQRRPEANRTLTVG